MNSYKTQIPNWYNSLLVGCKRILSICNLQINSSSSERAAQLKKLFIRKGVEKMLKAKYYKAAEFLLPFKAASMARAPAYNDNALLMTVHTAYSNLHNKLPV